MEAGPAQSAAAQDIWKNGSGFQGLTLRWRKVLSPLGLPGLAVICTRANAWWEELLFLWNQPSWDFLSHSFSSPSSLCTIDPLLPFLSGCIWLPLSGTFTLLFLTSPSSVCLQESYLLAAKLTVKENEFFSAFPCTQNCSFECREKWLFCFTYQVLCVLRFHPTQFRIESYTAW